MRKNALSFCHYCLILYTCLYLQGCMNMAMSSASAVYNRHGIQTAFTDHYITMKAHQALTHNQTLKNAHLSVATFNRIVLLTGEVPSSAQQAEAEQVLQKIRGVQEVYNLTTIASPSSPLKHMSDAWITSKVKAKLIASNEVDASQIKVVTENGTVFLMGTLPPNQATTAVDITRETTGVEKVVKIFSYLKVTKKVEENEPS